MTEDSSVARQTTGRNDCATLHNHSLGASLAPSLWPAKGPSVTNSPTSSSYNRPYPTLSTPTLMPASALPSITTPNPTIRPHNTTSLRPTASPTYLIIGTQPPTPSKNNITLVVPQETLLVLLEGLSLSLTAYQTEAFAKVSLQFIRKHLPIAVNSISITILTIDRFEVKGQQLLVLDRNNTEALIQVSKPSIRRFLFDEIPALSIRCQVGGSQLAIATNARNTTGDEYVNAIATFLILNYQSYISVLSKDPALEQLWSQSTPTTVPGSDSNNNGLNHPSSDSSRTSPRSTNWNLVGSTLGLSVVAVCALWLVRRLRRLRDQRVQQQSSIMADIHQDHIRGRNNEEKVTTLSDSNSPPISRQPETMDIISEESESGWNTGSGSTDDDGYHESSSSFAGTPSPALASWTRPTERDSFPEVDQNEKYRVELNSSLVKDKDTSPDEENPTWCFAASRQPRSILQRTHDAMFHEDKP